MAETDDGQEKTEEPSDKRVSTAQEEGQIAKTQEIGVFITITTSMVMLNHWGPSLAQGLMASLRAAFERISDPSLMNTIEWARLYAAPIFKPLIFFGCALMVLTVAGSLFQTGIIFSAKGITPKFDNVNPYSGFKKLFSLQIIVQLLKNFLKVGIIGTIVYRQVSSQVDYIGLMSTVPIVEAMSWCVQTLASIILKVSIFLAILAVFDYLFQWYTTHQNLMMTRQELRDEHKQSQLPENIRSRVRQVAMERAKRKIQKEVPTADVIITNPTHFAVALRYRRFVDRAPKVVAKGQDLLAATIRGIAKEKNVPLYEYPELARKLYKTVKVGDYVPADLYESVAQVLAFVYRVYKDRKKVMA